MAELKFPSGLKYSKEHQWIKVGGDVGIVGITDYAQHQLTDVVFVELPEAGNKIEQGKSYASIESVKSVSDVLSPVSGEVIEANKELEDKPELLNKEPYNGWIAKIRISDKAELDKLMTAEEYEKFVDGS